MIDPVPIQANTMTLWFAWMLLETSTRFRVCQIRQASRKDEWGRRDSIPQDGPPEKTRRVQFRFRNFFAVSYFPRADQIDHVKNGRDRGGNDFCLYAWITVPPSISKKLGSGLPSFSEGFPEFDRIHTGSFLPWRSNC